MSTNMCLKACFNIGIILFSSWESPSSGPQMTKESHSDAWLRSWRKLWERTLRPGFPENLFSALMSPENIGYSQCDPLRTGIVKRFIPQEYSIGGQKTFGQNTKAVNRKTSGRSLGLLIVSLCVCKMESIPASHASQDSEGLVEVIEKKPFLAFLLPHPFSGETSWSQKKAWTLEMSISSEDPLAAFYSKDFRLWGS